MSFELAQKVADAVLYEGYVLYPYRASSAKNQVRFQWGVVAPRGYAEAGGFESWEMQTECLIEPGGEPRIDLKIRCLQLQARTPEEATGDGEFRSVEFRTRSWSVSTAPCARCGPSSLRSQIGKPSSIRPARRRPKRLR